MVKLTLSGEKRGFDKNNNLTDKALNLLIVHELVVLNS
jgi:hypothetical protein